MDENNLIESFDNSLYRDDLADLGADIGDTCVDLLSESEALNSIPVLGLLKGIYKSYKSITTARLLKKVAKFLFSTSTIPIDEKHKFIDDLSIEIADRGSEFLLDFINRIDNINKVEVLSNLVKAEVLKNISPSEFVILCKIVENLPYTVFQKLCNYTEEQHIQGESEILFSSGLLYISSINPKNNLFRLNRNGYLLIKYGLLSEVDIPNTYPVKNSAYAVLG